MLKAKGNFFESFDWWMFSKLDEHLDEVHIPYYDPESNKMRQFIPDFLFWLKKGNNYYIIFADPKGIKHTEYQYKVDNYSKMFENKNDTKKLFKVENNNVKVYLFLHTGDVNKLSKGYKKYWFDRFSKLAEKMNLIESKTEN